MLQVCRPDGRRRCCLLLPPSGETRCCDCHDAKCWHANLRSVKQKSALWVTALLMACSTTQESEPAAAGGSVAVIATSVSGGAGVSSSATGGMAGGAASDLHQPSSGATGGSQEAFTGGSPSGGTAAGGASSFSGGSEPVSVGGTDAGAGGVASGGDGTGFVSGGNASGGSGSAGQGGGGLGGGGLGGGGLGGEAGSSSDVVAVLEAYLAVPREERGPIEGESIAHEPLSLEQAEASGALLWADFAAFVRRTRQAEHESKAITVGEHQLRYEFTVFGDKPALGRSLFISLHGGGDAEPSVNDEQWQNQMTLYQPEEGIYLCPRAPTDTWNLWHEAHIDPLLERLISNFIVLEEVNPDRVYVMGYSAGGDGVYQLGPRMADHWAAAAAMAGHPNDAQPLSLRNIGFTIHVGELDTAYDRNLVAQEWADQLDRLELADPAGYAHLVAVHADKPHWMDLEDAVAVPWMAEFTRNPAPETIVWYQDDVPHTNFYWLAVAQDEAISQTEVRATVMGQEINLETTGISTLKVRLSDSMLDLNQPVSVSANGAVQYTGLVSRTIATLAATIEERGDPRMVFSGEVAVDL